MTTFKVTLRNGANFVTEVKDFHFMEQILDFKDNDLFTVGKIITSKSQIESITLLSQETMTVESTGDLHMKGNLTVGKLEEMLKESKNTQEFVKFSKEKFDSMTLNEGSADSSKEGKGITVSDSNQSLVDEIVNKLSKCGIKFN